MAQFSTIEDLADWIAVRSPEYGHALLARQALRALPALDDLFRGAEKSSIRRNLALQFLRSAIVMTAAIRIPKLERYLLADAKSGLEAALKEGKRIENRQIGSRFLESIDAILFQRSVSDLVDTIADLMNITGDVQALAQIESDATKLDRAKSAAQLFQYRLWAFPPRYSQSLLFDVGQDLLNLMSLESDRWGHWGKWLDAKFEGSEPFGFTRQQGMQLESNIANLPERKWQAGPASIEEAFESSVKTQVFETQQIEGKAGSARSLIVRHLDNIEGVATNDQISTFLENQGISIERASLNWALTNLVTDRKISRVRRGQYSSNKFAMESQIEERSDFVVQRPEPQKSIAVQFDYDDEGKIAVDASAGGDRIRSDPDAIDRHSEVLYLAQRLIESFDPHLPGANSATELIADVRRYLECLGKSPKDIRPSILIIRGDGLRQMLRMQTGPSEISDVPPISDRYLLDLQRLVSSHNLLVGVDPHLAARDEALLGPEEKSKSIAPLDGKKALRDAVVSRVATPDVESVLSEEGRNVQLSHENPRLSRRYSEGVRNFARAVIASTAATAKVLWEHKGKIAAGVAALPTGAIVVARWAVANEAWFLSVFSDNPHMISVVQGVIDALKGMPIL